MTLHIATRASRLARVQAEQVGRRLGGDVEYVLVSTTGDRDQQSELHAIGGQGVFTKEVQYAVLDGRADLAVHSAKDLPAGTPAGLVLAAIPERADARDALVGCAFGDLPAGACVGTGSVRRRAQLAAARPDLLFGPLRGNIETRLHKRETLGYDAIVVAVAALDRLGLAGEIAEVLDPGVVLPQVGQGALALECRAGDEAALRRARSIDDDRAHRAVDAERAFLAELGGGCSLPCGALVRTHEAGDLVLDALLASLDGHVVLRTRVVGDDPADVGLTAARDLLDGKGGRALLEDVA
ncbi:MAG TPA: hydroxymethylbilane synthase [Acidimicrobiia bacterium]|nr:hydroxymethylbilane synthase [Acidimicrobiia bacterium]